MSTKSAIGLLIFIVVACLLTSEAFAGQQRTCTMTTENIYPAFYKEPVTVLDEGKKYGVYFSDGEHITQSPNLYPSPAKKATESIYGTAGGLRFGKGTGRFDGYYSIRFLNAPTKVIMINCLVPPKI